VRHDRKGFVLDSRSLEGLEVIRPVYSGDGSSLSGKERNHLFLSNFPQEQQFKDVSGISGLDSPADGRSFGIFDFDHDGWLDVAVASANSPLLTVYRNQVGSRSEAGVVALRFAGGNRSAAPSDEWSNRDGYGALVTVEVGGRKLLREHRCGEGFSAQNSSTMVIGVGDAKTVDRITVRWPSGRAHETRDVPVGTLLVAFENPEHDGGESFVRAPYVQPVGDFDRGDEGRTLQRVAMAVRVPKGESSRLRLFTTMTTHCQSCRKEMPELQHVRESFDSNLLAMYGVPMDEREKRDDLLEFAQVTEAPYELLLELPESARNRVREHVVETLGEDATPATIVTDAEGNVLLTRWGAPSVSELRRLLRD
jgi:hypothetical protein